MVYQQHPPGLFADPDGEVCLWVWIDPEQVPRDAREPFRVRIPMDDATVAYLNEDTAKLIRRRLVGDGRPMG